MKPQLWNHQKQAVEFCKGRRGSLLFCGLGTGKTRIAVELLEEWGVRTALVVAPLSVIHSWAEQLDEFGRRDWIVLPLQKKTVRERTEMAKEAIERASLEDRPILLAINYESVHREPFKKWALGQGFDALVCDESHRMKSPRGVQSKFMARLGKTVDKCLLLTGTPMPHSPLDIFAQARVMDPEVFSPNFYRFRGRYAVLGGYGGHEVVGYKNKAELRQKIDSFTFRAGREVLDLPEATHTRRMVELQVPKIYKDLEDGLRVEVESGEIDYQNALTKLLRLQQLTGGYAATDEGEIIDTAKEDELEALFNEMDRDEPVVVFAQFRHDLAAIHRAAERAGKGSLELSGQRRELEEWKRPDAPPVLAVQIHSGGVGVSLVRARICVYYSTGFNLGDYIQSLARCHRPGQEQQVSFYHLVAANTIDERVYEALKNKQGVVDAILNHLGGEHDGRTAVSVSQGSIPESRSSHAYPRRNR